MTAHQSLGRILTTSLICAAMTWSALVSWRGFTDRPWQFLGPLLIVAAGIAASGALLRWLRAPRTVTLAVQAILTFALVLREITGNPLPTGGTLAEFGTALADGMDSAQRFAAPIGATVPSVAPLMICGGALLLLVVDLLACGFRQVPLAGLGLLAVFSVPFGVSSGHFAWISFTLAAIGFLVLLYLDAGRRVIRWGRPIGPGSGAETTVSADVLRSGAGRIGTGALALALVVPVFVPVLDLDILGLGAGGGDDEVTIHNPRADLRRDLERGADLPLIRIETEDPHPSYLRVAVLNRFTGAEWSTGNRDIDADNRADGTLPPPAGVSPQVPYERYDSRVWITDDFDSTFLPTQFPAAAVNADGDWRFDPSTMDFLAGSGDNTRGLEYTMTSISYDYGTDGRFFQDPASGAQPVQFLSMPTGVPESIRKWTEEVTRKGTTDYERATLLQNWFRTQFEYDLQKAPDGIGNETLEGFLAKSGRVGYCEQFASAMAVMARILEIPARVAIGFLEPDQNSDGSWTYSSHDLHAWPELYFGGAGWVRFEPTPVGRVDESEVPAYSRLPDSLRPEQGSTGSTRTEPSGPTSSVAPPTMSARTPPPILENDDTTAATRESHRGSWLLGAGIGIVLLVLLGLVPGWLRRRLRARRVDGDPEQVWRELWATTTDLDQTWPPGRSPREIGDLLTSRLGGPDDDSERPRTGRTVDPEAAEALHRIVGAVERTRYAREGSHVVAPGELRDDALRVGAALQAGTSPRVRRRARWLPRSLFRRPVVAESPSGREYVEV